MRLVQLQVVTISALLGLTTGKHFGPTPDVWLLKTPGETALFSPNPAPFRIISWVVSNTTIITSSSEINFTNPEYEDRITLFSNGSLELRNVSLEDRGWYTANITSTESSENTTMFQLNVFEPVSDVRWTVNVIKFKTSVNITCSASGSNLQFTWYNSSLPLLTHSPVLSISPLTRYDTGPFRCEVSNPVNKAVSRDIFVPVIYGPAKVTVKIIPKKKHYLEGATIMLYCLVDSSPPAKITWYLNETYVVGFKPVLDIWPVTRRESGKYTCRAFNSHTMISKSSQPAHIRVTSPPVKDPLSTGTIIELTVIVSVIVLGFSACLCLRKRCF